MFKITKDEEYVKVSIEVQKRTLARDPKIYYYYRDALRELRKVYPDLKIKETPENNLVVSSVREPHQGTWRFKILEKPKLDTTKIIKKQKKQASSQLSESLEESNNYKELDKVLTNSEEPATIEETTEKVQEQTE